MRWLERTRIVTCLMCLGMLPLAQSAYIPTKAWLAQELMQRAWDRTTKSGTGIAPWPWADMVPVARLHAQAGRTDLIVLSGGTGRTLAFAPGYLEASAKPGDVGNTVIAGHRDTHFAFLRQVELGDSMWLERPDGERLIYEVENIDVIDARRGSIALDTGEPYLTLVTCYPFDAIDPGGPMRYVVTLRRIL
jgi:sortase A